MVNTFQEELETNKILMTEQFLTENDVILSVSNTINDFILSLANDNKYVVKLKPFTIPMYILCENFQMFSLQFRRFQSWTIHN